ncbi:uncharacterized protein A1O5_07506 [Cladophialophora psammophila CBS 110553]|uniref:Bromo domain-containing protein n=1 Tax=Cladophialophora psammophila CBS 110553 TaxID=1182543 RepID=W9WWP7_9EURO|nr:uncharacterized protein A1O5_07506 [Cladophialophora psammophila CBS 110553]EXJ69470.1 hypothetical protein A1O5_07506 [Cladophialophora psammophila CBS 110553]
MPSLKAYTPYETLAFCQSVVHHGSNSAAFEGISTALNANHLIRESETYDESRLTAAALQALYHELLVEEKSAQAPPAVNGDSGPNGTNPRKRKLSTSPAPTPAPAEDDDRDEQRLLQALVDKLYARFRENTIKEIHQEEEEYLRLQAEIEELEKAEEDNKKRQTETEGANKAHVQPLNATAETTPKPPAVQSSTDAATAALPTSLETQRTEQIASSATSTPAADAEASPASIRSSIQQPVAAARSPAPTTPIIAPKVSVEPAPLRPSQPPSAHPPQQSPGAFHRTLPVPSPQRPHYGAINPQHFQPGPQGQPVPVLPQYAGAPHMPPPAEFPPQKRGASASGQGRGSPVPMQQPQQPYPGYAGYLQQPPWPHMPPQYPQPPPYSNPPYYIQSPTGRPAIPYSTPHHPGYAPYPQGAPIHYQGQPPHPQIWPSPQPGQPYYGYPSAANVTPASRSDSRQSPQRGRSSTPWKKRSQLSSGVRPPSPTRPEREVSPLTDTESPTRTTRGRKSPGKTDGKGEESSISAREVAQPARGRQATSATPSAFAGSRSQSLASFTSDTPTDKRKKGGQAQKIKAEPSTPAPIPSDTEPQTHRTSSRRGRPRTSTATSKTDLIQPITASNKRKRSVDRDSTTPPASLPAQLPSPAAATTAPLHAQPSVRRQISLSLSHDPSLINVSKNFAKTALLLLNEIVSHKLASIFAKPLSERDAPGYKDLVLKPQDLKSIKAAVTKGGKAALAAIEAFEERTGSKSAGGNEGDGEQASKSGATAAVTTTPTIASDVNSVGGERALGNGVYILRATEDLVPPKGIVNSSQLEMELVRVFANAVMFNPLPSSERGFGRSLRLRKGGGDVALPFKEVEERDGDAGAAESEESDGGSSGEEGGIISDTREMFEDVMTTVRKWKELEVERLGNVGAGLSTEIDHTATTPLPFVSKSAIQAPAQGSSGGYGSASASVVISANPSLRHSESVEKDDEGAAPSTPAASGTGTARKRRRIADS